MIREISYIESIGTDPYENLAMEEYLFFHCRKEECILYLWQNEKTVVIGRNQNAWKECLTDLLASEGGRLARRLSGGGAVYQDLGNLNFTFLVRKDNYDLDRQLDVIIRAVSKVGIHAVKSGRNDIHADGGKFSGNAFHQHGDYCYHHGTLMVDVDIGELSRYLTVSKEKLKTKGIDSVRARVINLTALVPDLSVMRLKEAMLRSFEEVYGCKAKRLSADQLDRASLGEAEKKFRSWEWNYGRRIPFSNEVSGQFPWGNLMLQLEVKKGMIVEADVWSDSMKPDLVTALSGYLTGIRYDRDELYNSLIGFQPSDIQEKQMVEDITAWIRAVEL